MQRASTSITVSIQRGLGRRPFTRNTVAKGINARARIAPANMEDGRDIALFGAEVVMVNCVATAFAPGVTVLGEKEQLEFAGKPVQEKVTAS